MTGSHLLLGLAPSGVYLATYVAISTGELLPHRFTLTYLQKNKVRRFTFCCTFPWVAPGGRYPPLLPYGVRTFLDNLAATAIIRPTRLL